MFLQIDFKYLKPGEPEYSKDKRLKVYSSNIKTLSNGNEKLLKRYRFCKEHVPEPVNEPVAELEPVAEEKTHPEEEIKIEPSAPQVRTFPLKNSS